jgi:hypothetical protein
MATIRSTSINSGDPVTYDIINNLVLDLNELNKATAPTFSLTLDSTGTKKQDAAAVSQKIYSTVIPITLTKGKVGTGKWDFVKSNITFNAPPRCWIQVQNTKTSAAVTAFDFTTVITSVTTKSMSFQIRGPFTTESHEFICFAADA